MEVLREGQVFAGRYTIVRPLVAGGMGQVYEVLDHTERRRALKVMLPSLTRDPKLRERFRREATIAAGVESDHVVQIFDSGLDEETQCPFLVMELLRGQDLAEYLLKRGPIPGAEAISLLSQVTLAMEKMHCPSEKHRGIVHRDLKPENVFVTKRDDGTLHLKLLDFGIAKQLAETSKNRTEAVGSPLYMAPEQMESEGEVGPAADLYALAHIAYRMLAGESYWEHESISSRNVFVLLSIIRAGAKESPTRRAGRNGVELPAGFDDWFAKATAGAPAGRFASAAAQTAALADVLGVDWTLPRSAPSFPPPAPSAPKSAPLAMETTRVAPLQDTATPHAASRDVAADKRAIRNRAAVAAGIAVVGVLGVGAYLFYKRPELDASAAQAQPVAAEASANGNVVELTPTTALLEAPTPSAPAPSQVASAVVAAPSASGVPVPPGSITRRTSGAAAPPKHAPAPSPTISPPPEIIDKR